VPNFVPERGGDAHLALQDVVRDYGPSGLDNPKIFAQVLPDLLAGAPLAANLLNAAAAAGVGRLLTERIGASIPPVAAVRDVATLLSQRSALDIAAAQWVVAEYARVLGHPIDDAALAAMAPPAPMPPVHQMPMQAPPPVQQMAPPAQAPGPAAPVSGQPVSGQPVSPGRPAPGQPVAAGMAAGGIPPGGGMSAAGGDPNATQLDVGAQGQQAPGQPARISGRAAAPVQPNRGRVLDDTTPFPTTSPAQPAYPPYAQPGYPQQPGFPPPPQPGYGPYGQVAAPARRSKTPWIVGGVVLALIAAAVVAIVLVNGQKKCTGTACQTQPTHRPSVPVHPVSTPPTTPTPTPPAQVRLNQVMPKDINVSTCGPDTKNQNLMSNVTDSLACNEDASSTLPNAAVLGFQFGNQHDYSAGIEQLNSNTGIDPSSASGTCPPGNGQDTGVSTWHRGTDTSAPVLGKLECFTDSDHYNYFIWTDDDELTVEIVKADLGQSFDDIATWWGINNNNSTGQ
jgi:hypothetical protein